MPDAAVGSWDRRDLFRRVVQALDVAARTVRAAVGEVRTPVMSSQSSGRGMGVPRPEEHRLVLPKVVAESALLLRCAWPLRAASDDVDAACRLLADLLVPHARGDELLASLCLEPTLALDHALAHLQLRDLGYDDPDADALLAECLDDAAPGGPERPAHRELEQRWLRDLLLDRDDDGFDDAADTVLARSALARPLDVLGATTDDLYAATHLLLYAGDLGRRRVRLPRAADDVVAEVEAGLAVSLDADNFDLAAELLWTWPLLRRRWSPLADFAFRVLADAQDSRGFLPGPGWSAEHHRGLADPDRTAYELATSYHASLVMGLLCAASLNAGVLPADEPVARRDGSSTVPFTVVGDGRRRAAWQATYVSVDADLQASLAPALVAMALRRARDDRDFVRVREMLRLALEQGHADGPAPHQAVALLRRATLVARRAPGGHTSAEDGVRVLAR